MTTYDGQDFGKPNLTLFGKLLAVNWLLVLLVVAIACVGFSLLYSVAGKDMNPWALKQIIRFGATFGMMLVVAVIDIRIWMRYAYLIFAACLSLLIAVEVMGAIGMGAQRWIDLGVFRLQPSEVMKLALVLVLARYFHGKSYEDIGSPLSLIPPLILVLMPVGLVLRQPDLGTALLLLFGAGAVFFAAGVRVWKFALIIVVALAAMPIAWGQLKPYQQKRVTTFLNPEADPLGAGYHIMQSKIAVGSGGIGGKGFGNGTQSRLNFLPEKQTDFPLAVLAEEMGMIGVLGLMGLYLLVFTLGFVISVRSHSQFGRLLALGVTITIFLYMVINMGMVLGMMPVVGVPLPLISYGGSAMLTIMFGIGLLLCVSIHRDIPIGKRMQ